MSNALTLITTINTLLQLTAEAGISWTRLKMAIDKARREGRAFDLADLEEIANDTDAAIARLRAAIAAAKPAQ